MQPSIVVAPGAEGLPLAAHFAERLRRAARSARGAKRLEALRATVGIVDFDTGDALTIRFDHGRVVVHEGRVGTPTITFGGPGPALMALSKVGWLDLVRAVTGRPRSFVGKPEDSEPEATASPPARRSWPPPLDEPRPRSGPPIDTLELVRLYGGGDLKVYGALRHPRTVARFLELVSERC